MVFDPSGRRESQAHPLAAPAQATGHVESPLEAADLGLVTFELAHFVLRHPHIAVKDDTLLSTATQDCARPRKRSDSTKVTGHRSRSLTSCHVVDLNRSRESADGEVGAIVREA